MSFPTGFRRGADTGLLAAKRLGRGIHTAQTYLRGDQQWAGGVAITDGDKGDVTVSSNGLAWVVDFSAARGDTYVQAGDNLQAAIDNAADYATIWVAAGIFMAPDASGWIIDHPITIIGSGNQYVFDTIDLATPKTLGTVFRPYNAGVTANGASNSTVFQIVGNASTKLTHVVLKDFSIENPYGQPALGTGDGIRVDGTLGYITLCRLENISTLYMGRDGFHCDGQSLGISFDQSTISRCQFDGSTRHGAYLKYATDVVIDNSSFVGNKQAGLYALTCSNTHLEHCLFNENGANFVTTGNDWLGQPQTWPYAHQAQCYLQGCARCSINRTDFEVWNGVPVPHAIGIETCQGGCITNCSSYNASYSLGAVLKNFIVFVSDAQGLLVAGNQISECDNYILVLPQSGNRGNTILPPAVTVDDGAPCAMSLANDLETDVSGTPSSGNLVSVPLTTNASGVETAQSMGGLQLPMISATSAFTHTKLDGTLAMAADQKALRLYQDGAWQTVAAGVVCYDGDTVTYDDDVVSY